VEVGEIGLAREAGAKVLATGVDQLLVRGPLRALLLNLLSNEGKEKKKKKKIKVMW
jgi:hypothetical protein